MSKWTNICNIEDIVPDMGRCALFNDKQVAIFRIKDRTNTGKDTLYAISNHCPFSEANTLSRGIIGSFTDKTVVASPLYKQHFDLESGQCLEDESVTIKTYTVRLDGDTVQLQEQLAA